MVYLLHFKTFYLLEVQVFAEVVINALEVFFIFWVLEQQLVEVLRNIPLKQLKKLVLVQFLSQEVEERKNAAAKQVVLVFVGQVHYRHYIEKIALN